MKKATIHDICSYTGLSLGTVSKYLNGGKLREKNKAKLDEAIEALDYQVDEYARGLITNRTKTIGIIVSRLDNIFYSHIISDIEAKLYRWGYATIIRESSYDQEKEAKAISWFLSRRVDGLIIFPVGRDKRNYEILQNTDRPVIFLDNYIEGLEYDFVLTDNEEIGYETTDFIIRKGHRKIALIIDENNGYTAEKRLAGCMRALREHNIPESECKIYPINESINAAYQAAKEILSQKQCSAIFATNYISTIGTIYLLNEWNVSVPDSISVIGFDDVMITSLYRPKLTIVSQPMEKIADVTVRRLLSHLAGEDTGRKVTILKNKLLLGDTIAQK